MSSTVGEFFGSSGRRIRDGVWGDVSADKAARSLLETRQMLRLRGMSRLGFTHLAFPAARHTRYDHAVGVYYLTRTVLKKIIDSGAYLEDHEVRNILAAALLYDAGRYPFAQAIEKISLPGMIPRETITQREIEESEIAEVLKEQWELEPHNVFRLISRGDGAAGLPHNLTPTEHLSRDIISGSFNARTLDALVRDARGAKISYVTLDVESLIENLRIVGEDNRAILAVEENGIGLLQSIFFARYLMHYNVYGHAALRAPTVMILRAAQDAIQAEKVSPEELSRRDDSGALELISTAAEPGSSSAVLVKRLIERQPYKLAVEFDERHPAYYALMRLREDATWRRRVEEAWARYLTRYHKGVAGPFDILIDLPEHKKFDFHLRLVRQLPLLGERNPLTWQAVSGLAREDIARYHAPLNRVRIVTANDSLITSVRRHADELLTIAEELG